MDRRSFDTDIVVVGGGPAGSATAISCAQRGLRVILCEREKGDRDRPGETLHPGAEAILTQLGVADRLAGVTGARHEGIWIEKSGKRHFEAFGGGVGDRWMGLQVWRADFDALLLGRAAELGVEIRRGCAPRDVLRTGPAVCGVRMADGDISARMVVDATGAARWLGRIMSIDTPARSPRLIAHYGYAEGSCPERDQAPLLVADASGWTWTARVKLGLYQWTRMRFGETGTDIGPPEELRRLSPVGRTKGADVTWRMATQTSGPGWFIVGDAAAVLDPASSHGVLKALMSGTLAGQLIEASLSGKAPPAELSGAYHRWLAGWFETDILQLGRFYRELGAMEFA
ncbi:NAD(P)/FAD-dependent oxidoreductase [Kaistia terrae]|uniref:NAD(P)/FAD-dependent oxidoreductase n=1 Tax=Kaistia terrae TaxID=537017 RepID=A0ABW0PRU4_9HYPH|nr:NAD(P)/FAD-dependent oxidoreductase [Kaistia terrae]MCX5577651.1 NAD(P)/FAD-dependent oxidoreductase [Kaistia terrae]